jgi:hypothetical protein
MYRRWYMAGGFILLILLIVLVDRAEDVLTHISYPFNVWRMDLDDIAANIGLFLVGLAAFMSVFRKADRAHKKADQVSERINGGMMEMAKQHVAIATQEAQETSHYIDLLTRITNVEKQRDNCHEELEAIRGWINTRLDETGNGRNDNR